MCISSKRWSSLSEGDGEEEKDVEQDRLVGFNNFWVTTITLFQISTLAGWTPIMYHLQDCEGPIQIYFISFLMVVSFLILNLMVGVICDAYSVVAEEDENFEPPPKQGMRTDPIIFCSSCSPM